MSIPNTGIALVFGNYIFTDESNEIISGSGANHQAMIADTLSADELSFIVSYNPSKLGFYLPNPSADAGFLYTGDGKIFCVTAGSSGIASNIQPFEEFTYATPIQLYQNGTLKYTYYLTNIAPQSVQQDGTIWLKFECVSFIGLTVNMQHDGGLYVNGNAGNIIAEILGATKNNQKSTSTLYWYDMANSIHYTMDKLVANTRVDGHLPCTNQDNNLSARDNLRDVLFACGISILKNSDGSLYFTFNQPSLPIDIPSSKIYMGDAFATTERVTKVSVIEHAYYQIASTAEVVLYDTGSDIVSNAKVVFNQPCFSLRGDGVTISSSNCNTATISGIGVLYGKPYTHTQQQYTQATGLTGTEKLLTADNGLITLLNYENVLKRIKNYYSTAREVNNAFVLENGIGTGSLVRFADPLNREKTGMVSELKFTLSGIIKADSTIVTNWAPTEAGNNFEHCAELTGSGTWSKAAAEAQIGKSINAIRVVLISGGNGGSAGSNGSNGSGTSGGAGGIGGASGAVGKVKSINWGSGDTIPSTISYSCGAGGASGSSGGATTAIASGRIYSTNDADATRPVAGYMNIINQNIYCLPGVSGINGGNGGNGATAMKNSSSSTIPSNCYGVKGDNVTYDSSTWTGGTRGSVNTEPYYSTISGTYPDYTFSNRYTCAGGSGGGGGAAYGTNGGSAGSGSASNKGRWNGYDYGIQKITSGKGGAGANALSPTGNPGYGNGGNGGHGGGGGGGRGTASAITTQSIYISGTTSYITTITASVSQGSVGSGGSGSAGSAGGAGLCIIFY